MQVYELAMKVKTYCYFIAWVIMCNSDDRISMSLDSVRVALDTKLCNAACASCSLQTTTVPNHASRPRQYHASIPSKYSSASHKKPQLQPTIGHLLS